MNSQEKNHVFSDKTRKSTIKDIAHKAMVSDTTVSLSFREGSRISARTRSRVLEVAKSLGYSPNTAARDLRTGRTKTLGFLINDITNPFYGSMVRTSEQIANNRGYQMVFSESQWTADNERRIVKKMIENRSEGIILCFSEKNDKAYQLVRASDLQYVVVDTKPDFYTGSYVVNDSRHAGYLAAQHLHDVGCESIVFLNAKRTLKNFSSIRLMEEGFQQFFVENGKSESCYHVYDSGLTILSGIEAFRSMQSNNIKFDGIFCMNDLCAMGVMHASAEAGLIPGKDFAIVGVDNSETSDLHMIQLSSISIRYDRISEVATNYLIDILEGKTTEEIKTTIRPELVIRESSGGFGNRKKRIAE